MSSEGEFDKWWKAERFKRSHLSKLEPDIIREIYESGFIRGRNLMIERISDVALKLEAKPQTLTGE